jgi:hypothetical protein
VILWYEQEGWFIPNNTKGDIMDTNREEVRSYAQEGTGSCVTFRRGVRALVIANAQSAFRIIVKIIELPSGEKDLSVRLTRRAYRPTRSVTGMLQEVLTVSYDLLFHPSVAQCKRLKAALRPHLPRIEAALAQGVPI